MEKKSLPENNGDPVQPYEFVSFDAPGPKDLAAAKRLTEEDILARVRAREEEGHAKGYAAGNAQGLKQGEKDILAKLAGLSRLEDILRELERFRETRLEALLPEFLELSEEIAVKIIFREIKLDKTIVVDVAADALKRVSEREEPVTIKVNPQDYEIMIASLDLLKEGAGLRNIAVEPQATISPGGCYIETRTGEIDARIEEKIREVKDAIGTAAHSQV